MIDVFVFAKAPRPGHAKTRLAEAVGADRALRLYRDIGERVVERLRSVSRVTVWYDPPDALFEMRAWLGDVSFRPQGTGDLGARLGAATTEHFEAHRNAPLLIVGADAPGVGAETVAAAERALTDADVVFGPSVDGGYYLVGFRRPVTALFEGIPWSTDGVLEATLATCHRLGVRVATLPVLRDVDTIEDARALGYWPT